MYLLKEIVDAIEELRAHDEKEAKRLEQGIVAEIDKFLKENGEGK